MEMRSFASSMQLRLKRLFVLFNIRQLREDARSDEAGLYYSTRLPPAAVHALFSRLAPSSLVSHAPEATQALLEEGGREELDTETLLHRVRTNGIIFFSVVRARPQTLHRAMPGGLCAHDIGITLHKLLSVEPEDHSVRIDAAPCTFSSTVASELGPGSLALILTPSAIPLRNLRNIKKWQLEGNDIDFAFRSAPPLPGSATTDPELCKQLLEMLAFAPDGIQVSAFEASGTRQATDAILGIWLEA
eukprot:2919176-Amphidinium_carterae.1